MAVLNTGIATMNSLVQFSSVHLNLITQECCISNTEEVEEKGYLLPTLARKITCRRFD